MHAPLYNKEVFIVKKEKKLKCLADSKGTYNMCQCIFDYDRDISYYYYIVDYSEKLFIGACEEDFLINGFRIHKVSYLDKIKIRNDITTAINEKNRILDGIDNPDIELSSWKETLQSLKGLKHFVIIQNEMEAKGKQFFYLGRINKIKKSKVIFTHYDVNGSIKDNIEIPFDEITSITFGDRYSKTWEEYISKSFRFTYDTD